MSSPSSPDREGDSPARRRVALIGSTGSIGRQAVDVLAAHPDAFEVVALAAGTDAATLAEQAARLRPRAVSLADPAGLAAMDLPPGTERVGGADALEALAVRDDVDLVVVGTGGVVSLRPVLAALRARKVVATANKETLVAGGHLVMPLARAHATAVAVDGAARPVREPARLAPADRFGALGDLAEPRRRIDGGRGRADPHRVRRSVPRREPGGARGGHAGAGPPAPDLDDGGEDHDRLGDAREQGPGGHRGTLAVRCRLRRDRGRHPPAERRPLRRPLPRRLPQGPAGYPRHATSDPVRPDVPAPPAVAGRGPRPRGDRAARLPRAGRGPVPGAPHRPRGGAPGSAGVRGAHRRR